MSRFLHRLGGFSARHPWRVIAAWAAAAVVVLGLAASYGGSLNDDYVIPDTSSQRAYDLLREKFPAFSGADARVVVHADSGTVDPADLEAAQQQLAGVEHVSQVAPAMVSADGATALIAVQYDVPVTDFKADAGIVALEDATADLDDAGLPGRVRRPDAGELRGPRRHRRDGRHRHRHAHPVPRVRLLRGRRAADRHRPGRSRHRHRRGHPARRHHRRHHDRAHPRLDDRHRRRCRLRAVHRHPAPRRAGPWPVRPGRRGRGHRHRRPVRRVRRQHRPAGPVRPAVHRRTELPGDGLRPGAGRPADRAWRPSPCCRRCSAWPGCGSTAARPGGPGTSSRPRRTRRRLPGWPAPLPAARSSGCSGRWSCSWRSPRRRWA